ncbi:PDZ domain-containing protein [Rhodoferax sp. BAB1]|uniref:PDZ domain-containing protein n=1 Tax=Rhodoferax sp. BAB1 TaxID=2741720 RepID=UPI001574F4EF|nr:PDZ domain-containing protein [Rhodoferax sp. BAB1]QKO21142.1 PDZ domain-containing protein [Rhodoferax sp. BAB1]
MKRILCFAALMLSLLAAPSMANEVPDEALAVPLKALRRVDSPLLQDSAGVVAQAVVGGSQAAAAGLQAGDLLIRYGDRPIHSMTSFISRIGKTSATDSLNLVFLRQGETRTVQVRGGRLGVQLFDGSDKFWFNNAKSKLRLSHDGLTVDLHAHARLQLTASDTTPPATAQVAASARMLDWQAYLNTPALLAAKTQPPLAAPLTETAGMPVTDWKNSLAPKFNGKPLALARGESSRALAIAPDTSRFVLGTDSGLRMFDRNGQQLWYTSTATETWAVNLSGDGRYVVAAFVDGSLRWFGAADGQERLALLLMLSQDNWLAWTPEGHYIAANPADPRLGQEIYPTLSPAARRIKTPDGSLNPEYHRPDLALAALLGSDAGKSATSAAAPAGRRLSAQLSWVNNQNLPPPAEVAAPRPIAGNSGRFFSPYTSTGAMAMWVIPQQAAPGGNSEIAGTVGSQVGKQVGSKLLDFVPFGLGSAVGAQLGDSMARNAAGGGGQTTTTSPESVRAQSDLSFNTLDELAAYLYAQHSARADYGQALERTFAVYPELRRLYPHAIYRAELVSSRSTPAATATAGANTSARDRLLQLQQLKSDGLITEAEYQARRSRILEGL